LPNNNPDLSWEIHFPLVTNPLVLKAWFKAMGATYLIAMLIMAAIFIGTGEPEALPMLAVGFALAITGLTLLGLLIMLLLFGNRFHARFTLTDKGIVYESLDSRARTLARMAVVAGALGASPRTAGAGLLAVSNERIDLAWSGVCEARYHPKQRTIVIRNQWRDLLQLYCSEENYEVVKRRVESRLASQNTTASAAASRSPLPEALLATALVVAACLPLFAMNDITGLDIFVPLLILLFSLATVWLIPLFGWVVLPLEGYVLLHIGVALVKSSELKLVTTYRFRKYELLDAGEWILLVLAVAGMTYLALISWRAVHGRLVPVLFRDRVGAGQ